MELQEKFSRRFSSLPGLQAAQTVQYYLSQERSDGATQYGIQLTRSFDGALERDNVAPFTSDQCEAELLLIYLYEHSVLPAQCQEVISDARQRCALNRSVRNERGTDQAVDCRG